MGNFYFLEMVFFQDFADRIYRFKLKVAKKKLFPNTWGCVGEMSLDHFRKIIISQWVLLSTTLILLIALVATGATEFLAEALGLFAVFIGMIASGFGTSIYSSADQEGPDMPVKKALFNFSTILYILGLLGAIGSTIFVTIYIDEYDYTPSGNTITSILPVFSVFIIILVFYICLLILALVTLIMRTCCIWNKNDREWMEKSVVENTTDVGVSV